MVGLFWANITGVFPRLTSLMVNGALTAPASATTTLRKLSLSGAANNRVFTGVAIGVAVIVAVRVSVGVAVAVVVGVAVAVGVAIDVTVIVGAAVEV